MAQLHATFAQISRKERRKEGKRRGERKKRKKKRRKEGKNRSDPISLTSLTWILHAAVA